jgi:hypothetical protein
MKEASIVRRLWLPLILFTLLAACTAAPTPEAPPDPVQLMNEATSNVLGVNTLKIIVDRSGADYIMVTDIGNAVFNRIEAQYVAPATLQAQARVVLSGIPAQIEIFAQDEEQWWRLVGTEWQNMVFLPGFNPRALLQQEGRGLRAAFAALDNVTYQGITTLDDGSSVYHLTATADGAEISWLMLYLVQITGQTTVDAYIDTTTRLPLRFVIVQPDTATEEIGPTTWNMEFYDFDTEAALDVPAGAGEAESTAEATLPPTLDPAAADLTPTLFPLATATGA